MRFPNALRPNPIRLRVALCALVLSAVAAVPADATDVVAKLGADERVDLPIGGDLFVAWPAAPPDGSFTFVLVDAVGNPVTSRTVSTGPTGWGEPLLLWKNTSVIGCDPSILAEGPLGFPDFDDATDDLLGAIFRVQVLGQGLDTEVEIVLPDEPIYYFSDALGCPRSTFDAYEVRYLSAWIPAPGVLPGQVLFFLERQGCPLHIDVRPEPQAFELPAASRRFTAEIGTPCEIGCGDVVGWVRESHEAACFDTEGDACGPTWCQDDAKVDIEVHAIGWSIIGPNIQSKGATSADADDGLCDSCADLGDGDV